MSLEILNKQIKNNDIASLYLFYGPEQYLKSYYLKNIQKRLVDPNLLSLNRIVMEGKVSIDKIIDNCETLPVFSEKKLIVVKYSDFFKRKTGGVDELIKLCKSIPQHVCLIFYEDEIDKRTRLVKSMQKNGFLVEFKFLKPAELVRWTIKVFKSKGKEIDIDAASWLVDNCERGMSDILNEVNKVILYANDKSRVTVEELEKVCVKSTKSKIFDLTDAILQKDPTAALRVLNEMVILKEPIPVIIYMITRQFRHLMEMKLLQQEGIRIKEAASKIGLTPYTAKKVLGQAQKFSINKLKNTLEKCLELDTAIKTGKINDRIAIELLITEFCQ